MIKTVGKFIAALFLFIMLSSFYHPAETGIKVTITNLRNNKGHVLISLFKEGVGYPDKPDKAFRKTKLAISDHKTAVLFTDLPSGNYAIAILHDENDDQKMNTNFFGLPKEGYGFSNNVMGTFGPPSHSKASFSYTTPGLIYQQIKTRY